MSNRNENNLPANDEISRAKNLFRFLAEVKKLSSPKVRDYDNYDEVIWISDIPREKGCYAKAWELINQPAEVACEHWVEIEKPAFSPPPELPDSVEPFVSKEQWRDSACESPSLLEVSREQLIRHLLPDEDAEPEFEQRHINENEDVFDAYVEYVEGPWKAWAESERESQAGTEYPKPPDLIEPWLDTERISDFRLAEPPLMEEISVEVDTKFQQARQQLEKDWGSYLNSKWHPWAEEDRRLQSIQRVYNQLYSAYQSKQKLGEQYEIVICFGLLSWNGPESGRIRRHVLTAEAAIEFDARKGLLTVDETPNGSNLSVEDDMLHPDERPQLTEKERIDQQAKAAAGNFWDQAILNDLSKSFVNALTYNDQAGVQAKGQFTPVLERPSEVTKTPVIQLAPAIVLRKRSQRGYIRLLKKIEENIENGGAVPGGIKTVLTDAVTPKPPISDPPPIDYKPAKSNSEIYFPLPANKEQKKIIHSLNRGKGVLVQGPPGTGKSHTITNLICHLLASGQRVLVTSETERALRSLRSKFIDEAEPLADLAVILLGNDTASLKELEKSVAAINTKNQSWNSSDSKHRIEALESRLTDTRERLRRAWNDLKAIREDDVYQHKNKFGRYNGSLQDIAQDLAAEEKQFDWFGDTPDQALRAEAVFKDMAAEIFVKKWFEYAMTNDVDAEPAMLDISQLPDDSTLDEQIQNYNRLRIESENIKPDTDAELYERIKLYPADNIDEVVQSTDPIVSGLRTLKQHLHGWAYEAGKQIVAGQGGTWRALFSISKRELDKCEPRLQTVSQLAVSDVEDNRIRALIGHTEKAIRYAEEGRQVKKSFFHPKEYREALDNILPVTLDRQAIHSLQCLRLLLDWLVVKDALNVLKDHWASVARLAPASIALQIEQFKSFLEPLERALGLHDKAQSAQSFIDELPHLEAPEWHSLEDLEKFHKTFLHLQIQNNMEAVTRQFEQYALHVSSGNPASDPLIVTVIQSLAKKDRVTYREAIKKITAQNETNKNKRALIAIGREIRAKLPETFRQLTASSDQALWAQRFTDLQLAISWKQASLWIDKLCAPEAAQRLKTEIEGFSKKERQLLGQIAKEKAWDYCLGRLGEVQRQALVAWLQAVARIGKGTGKYAERHRRVARDKLAQCQSAIPAWAMPLHRVVDTVEAEPEIFDVAIIDEASQSGSEALILNYIAKKVIVVGDDKQIWPQTIGVDHDEVERLRKLYLKDLPHSETFDIKSSYFSQAHLRFSEQVDLREHFRCMPEIIQFSNQYFYQSAPLIPLKQFGSDRLEPVLTVYVEEGFREGGSNRIVNKPEARKLVERVAECCSDPAYAGKSMGIITLLGNHQSGLIQDLLLKEISPEEYEARKIMVGSAYAFQGDERDIIFISMVDAPQDGRMCRAETKVEREREFNVAASRAKEQMILFHSPGLSDLKHNCLKHKLLNYCLNPEVKQLPFADYTLDELRARCRTTDRVLGHQPEPFDSWFEVDVFLKIANRGYQLIPQYEVNPSYRTFRIDMVIEGMHGKLAVECDGDHWHGPAQYESDRVRQRELERCGWKFWRVRSGAFYRDSDSAMSSLWALLDKRGIYPEGQRAEAEPANVVSSVTEKNSVEKTPETDLDQAPISKSLPHPERSQGAETAVSANKKQVNDLTPADIQNGILKILSSRPNNSIAIKSIAAELCRAEGIRTRGAPREALEKKIRRCLNRLKNQCKIEQYKAKNQRIRLIG